MQNFVNSAISLLPIGMWAVLKAALLLVLAFIVSAIIKSFIVKLLDKINLDKKLDSDGVKKTKDFIGKLVYLLVFLLFVPEILSTLGMNSISAPLTGVLSSIWGYIPNILAAVIVLLVGFMVARLVRQLLVPVFAKIKIDKLQDKAGIELPETAKLSSTLAYIVYVLILIPVIITALNALDIDAVSIPAITMLSNIIGFIPNIVIGLILIIVGCMIGKLGGQVVEKLVAASGLDSKLSAMLDGGMKKFLLSKVVGVAVQAVIIVFFFVEGINILNLYVLTNVGTMVISYVPYVIAAALILVGSLLLSSAVGKLLEKYSPTYAILAKCAILTIGSFMILSQLGIAATLVNTAFILIIGALAVAFAVSFGLGGQTFAGNILKRLEDNIYKGKTKKEDEK